MTGHPDEYIPKEPLIQFDIGVALAGGAPLESAIRGWWVLDGMKALRYHLGLENRDGRSSVLSVRARILGSVMAADGVSRRFVLKMSGMIMLAKRCPISF